MLPVVLVLTLFAAQDARAQSSRALRWQPSPSAETAGYILYIGNAAGFALDDAQQEVDIGTNFTLENGVARYPVGSLIGGPVYLKMTAYDATGTESVPSNELFFDGTPEPECTTNAQCSDGNMCNGLERCSAGTCVPADGPLVCPAPTSCQTGRCDPILGCILEALPDGSTCDDGDLFTSNDVCTQGQCRGALPAPDPTPVGRIFGQDFEGYLDGADPEGWRDTKANFSLTQDDSLFHVARMNDGNRVMHTRSNDTDIHSHMVVSGSENWADYDYRGRMLLTDLNGGIGLTGVSGYGAGQDSYVRLRSFRGSDFQIRTSPLGSSSCAGDTRTDVVPQANTWYDFRFEAAPSGSGSRIRTKVWRSGQPEPVDWQTDCIATTGRVAGTVGLWAAGPGEKFWDELELLSDVIAPLPEPEPECTTDAQCSDGNACNGAETCNAGSCSAGVAPVCLASSFCMEASCEASVGCVEAPANGRLCDDGDACTVSDVCQGGSCSGAARSCPAPTQCQVGSCDSILGCLVENLPDGTGCDDGNLDTVDDLCGAGICLGIAIDPEEGPEPDPEPIVGELIGDGPILMYEDFQSYGDAQQPLGWLDTNALLGEDPALFRTALVEAGNVALSSDANVSAHSHFVSPTSSDWAQYAYRGRMFISDEGGGIGATLHSKVPDGEDRYLRVRRHASQPSFHLSSHQGGSCVGNTDTGVSPLPGFWYDFHIRTVEEADGLRVVARVWREDEVEPSDWQIDCTIALEQTTRFGTAGVWASGTGTKLWDDLLAVQVEADLNVLYFEDFERYPDAGEADGWFDTGANFSLAHQPTLFDTHRLAGSNGVLRTRSQAIDIHSTLVVPDGSDWSSYELDGRMQLTQANGGVGVLVQSGYPQRDRYVRLRSYHGGDFQIRTSPLGASSCDGDRATGVVPAPNTWMRFRLEMRPEAATTRVRAKVWAEGAAEPEEWQADCVTNVGANVGRIGVWAAGAGEKYWDDLRVRIDAVEAPVPPQDDPATEPEPEPAPEEPAQEPPAEPSEELAALLEGMSEEELRLLLVFIQALLAGM